jgi:hypothetical protein
MDRTRGRRSGLALAFSRPAARQQDSGEQFKKTEVNPGVGYCFATGTAVSHAASSH